MNGITAVLTTPSGLFVSLGLIGLFVIGIMYWVAAFWLRQLAAPASWHQRHRSATRPVTYHGSRISQDGPRLSQRLTTASVSSAAPKSEVRWTMPRQPKVNSWQSSPRGSSAAGH